MVNPIVNTGRTHKLGNNNTLRTVNHERTVLCHQRKVSHIDLMLVNFFFIFIKKANFHLERCSIGSIPLLALFNGVLCFGPHQFKVHKLQTQMTGKVLDGRNIIKGLPEPLMQKPLIGILLDFNEVRHFKDFFTARESHPEIFSGLHRMHFAFFHRPFTPNV